MVETLPKVVQISNRKTNILSVSIKKLLDYRHILRGLAVVLKDDGDVHVDDDEEADDQIGEKEGDGHDGVTTVSLISRLRISWKTNIIFSGWKWKKSVLIPLHSLGGRFEPERN